MVTWKTETQKAKQGIVTTINTGKRTISEFFSGTVKKVVSDVSSVFKNGATVVGINVNQIPTMKEAIRNYVADIEKALAELKNYDPTVAFQGEQVVIALQDYIDAVIETCGAIVSHMLAFNDQLTEVEKAYRAKDVSAASAIMSSAESTRSAYSRYTENS